MSVTITKIEIVKNDREFAKATQRCDRDHIKSETYPCAIIVREHDGQGWCDTWWSYTAVNAPKGRGRNKYLAGVIGGWKALAGLSPTE